MNQRRHCNGNRTTALEVLAERAYSSIASAFPVCACSDEFYFFPQVVQEDKPWDIWDDFSAQKVAAVADVLRGYERDLSKLAVEDMSDDDQIDFELLLQVLRTLREQLTEVEPHRSQPTFHLTVLAAGLAEALASPEPQAWPARVAGVPVFLQRAAGCLSEVPELFHVLGVEMLRDMQLWIERLQVDGFDTGEMPGALRVFQDAMKRVDVVVSPLLPGDVLDRLIAEHLGCGMSIDAIAPLLQDELIMMEEVLAQESAKLAPGKSWIEAGQIIPFAQAPGNDLLALYRRELEVAEFHCRRQGLVPGDASAGVPLEIAKVPDYLAAIRASDAYAATPGYPPRGGIFFVMEGGQPRNHRQGRSLEYRMTAAHEAWPGHHLLDSCRWNLARPLRRPVESPLFYEGWACLAEELMARTGYFDGPWDRFLLAKRRAERAARGLIDLGLQSGQMTIVQAHELLQRVGYPSALADSVVPKYLLRPGYQICYTLGLKQGLDQLERFGDHDVGLFARTLLSQGEIGFSRLAKILSAALQRSQP